MVAATVADGAADTRGRDSGRDGWRGAAEEEETEVAVQPAKRQEGSHDGQSTGDAPQARCRRRRRRCVERALWPRPMS